MEAPYNSVQKLTFERLWETCLINRDCRGENDSNSAIARKKHEEGGKSKFLARDVAVFVLSIHEYFQKLGVILRASECQVGVSGRARAGVQKGDWDEGQTE